MLLEPFDVIRQFALLNQPLLRSTRLSKVSVARAGDTLHESDSPGHLIVFLSFPWPPLLGAFPTRRHIFPGVRGQFGLVADGADHIAGAPRNTESLKYFLNISHLLRLPELAGVSGFTLNSFGGDLLAEDRAAIVPLRNAVVQANAWRRHMINVAHSLTS
jgi:hypothetical protein